MTPGVVAFEIDFGRSAMKDPGDDLAPSVG
jgi:hypothetical protein